MEKQKKVTLGIKLIIGFFILNLIIFVFGQGGAVVSYDFVAKLGLQEARETIDPLIVVIIEVLGSQIFSLGFPFSS